MKRLLVVLVGLLALTVFAAELPFKMGTWGNLVFTAIIDEEGIDLTTTGSSFGAYMVTFTQESGKKVSVNFSFTTSLGINTSDYWLKLETPLFDMEFNPTAILADDFVFYVSPANAGVTAVRNLTVTPKLGIQGLGLSLYYADIVSETDLNDATNNTNNYFDDAVGLKLSITNLDLFNVTVFGAFYDTDTTTATSKYAYAAHVNLSGKDVLSGLSLDFAYTSDNATHNYIVVATYSKTFDFGIAKLYVSPKLNYSEGSAKFYDNNTKQDYEGWNSDTVDWNQKYVSATMRVDLKPVDFLTIYVGAKPKIPLDNPSNYTLPVRAGALFDYQNFKVFANVRMDVEKSSQPTWYWYNVGAAYQYGELLAGVLYGTYRDGDDDFFRNKTLIDTDQDGNILLSSPTFFGFFTYRLAF